MLNVKYKITFTSGHPHPYDDYVDQSQNQFLSALITGLLKRLIEEKQTSIDQQLRFLYDNKHWNDVKDYSGFKKDKNKNFVDPFITSSRHLILFNKLFKIFKIEAGALSNSLLICECLDRIPQELLAEILEELLDRFMEEEQYRRSPQDHSPFCEALTQSQSVSPGSEPDKQVEEYEKLQPSPQALEEEIQTFQAEERVKFSHLSYIKSEVESKLSKVQYELSELLHKILVNLHPRRTEASLINEYIAHLNNVHELNIYGERPVYKLALRVRNILVLSYFKESVTFPKNIIKNVVDKLVDLFSENLEIALAVNLAKGITSQEQLNSYVKNTVYPLLCMMQKRIINIPIHTEIPEEFHKNEILSSQYINLVNEAQIYNPIPTSEFLISNPDEIYLKIIEVLIANNNFEELRLTLRDVFLKAAQEIASLKSLEIDSEKFETEYFARNSSNVLLEFSRFFLCSITEISSEQGLNSLQEVLMNPRHFLKLFHYLDSHFPPISTWTVYLPVEGIKVSDNVPRAFFPEQNPSASELYEIKFISAKILDSISIQSTSKILGQPVIMFSTDAVDACAVIANISARNGYQAATTAITILLETIESQFYFMNYGYQYQIKLHRQPNKTTVCFSKKSSDPALEQPWSISTVLLAGWRGTTEFDLTEQTEKLFSLPSRLFKIVSDRAKRNDSLGSLAQDLIHCIKLYRQGYFAEQLSERFRLYWTILDTILLPEDTAGKAIHLIPYRVSMFCLGIENLIEAGDAYTYQQARLWMREDIEDLYTLVRNPLIHKGINHAPAYQRLLERVESIVRLVLRRIADYVIYMHIPEDFLEKGLDGIISFLEQLNPGVEQISNRITATDDTAK
jgi:hypothetical protein